MKLPDRTVLKKFAIPIISGAIIFVCVVLLAVRFSAVSDREESIALVSDEVETMRLNLKNLNNLEEQLAQIEEITSEVRARTINPEDTAVNTDYFYGFETEGLKIETVEQRTAADRNTGPWKMKNFGTTLFTIRAVGSFQKVMDLAYRIRGGEKIARLINFSVTPADAVGERKRRISMTVETLSQLPEEKP